MWNTRHLFALPAALILGSCVAPPPAKLTVAAASNLTGVFDTVAAAFEKQTGIHVALSYGSTAELTQQIENGAPFDVFAAADTAHVDQLIQTGHVLTDSRAVYARGQLALWIPDGEKLGVREIKDLARPEVRFVAIAEPTLAPYGRAAVEALKSAGMWDALQPKVVYASTINMARQYTQTGNATAGFAAFSLVAKDRGVVVKVDPRLYAPIDQALGIVSSSVRLDAARRFTAFLSAADVQTILRNAGYLLP